MIIVSAICMAVLALQPISSVLSATWATRGHHRTAVRAALTGAAGRAANRFFRGATSKSTEFSIAALPGGRFHLAYFSPARNAGYGKQYHQIIDVEGFVLREFKETWGPDGLIETKWIHGAPDDQ